MTLEDALIEKDEFRPGYSQVQRFIWGCRFLLRQHGIQATIVQLERDDATSRVYVAVKFMNGHKVKAALDEPSDQFIAACLLVHDLPELKREHS